MERTPACSHGSPNHGNTRAAVWVLTAAALIGTGALAYLSSPCAIEVVATKRAAASGDRAGDDRSPNIQVEKLTVESGEFELLN